MFSAKLFFTMLVSVAFSAMVTAQELIELPIPASNKIVIKLVFKNGSISDPSGLEGLTQLIAQMLVQGGTKDNTAKEITDLTYPMAARYSASVDKEVSVFTFEVHQDKLSQFYPIVRNMVLKPGFREEDFKRIRSNQQNYVDQVIRTSSDEEYSKKALEDLLFRTTNYQYMVHGTSKGVAAITLESIKTHYAAVFNRNNLTIGIAGNYPAGFTKTLTKDFAALPVAKKPQSTPGKANQPDGIQVEIITKKGALGSAIFTGFPLPVTRSDNEFAALMVANSYFGEHRKSYSLLYQKIREKRSMNYGDYSYIEWYENGGQNMLPVSGVPRKSNYFSIWIRPVQTAEGLRKQYAELSGITTGHAHFALRMAISELEKLIKDGMTNEDFELTRTFLRSYMKLYPRNTSEQLGYLMDSRFYGRKDYLREMDGLLANLKLEDVNNAIRKYLQVSNMFVTIVTDQSEAAALAESLKRNTPSPMSYSDELKKELAKEILEEDEVVSRYPLNIKSVKIIESADTFKL